MGVGGQCYAPAALLQGKRPGTHCTGGWVDARACLEECRNLVPTGNRSPDSPARSKVALPTELSQPTYIVLLSHISYFLWLYPHPIVTLNNFRYTECLTCICLRVHAWRSWYTIRRRMGGSERQCGNASQEYGHYFLVN